MTKQMTTETEVACECCEELVTPDELNDDAECEGCAADHFLVRGHFRTINRKQVWVEPFQRQRS